MIDATPAAAWQQFETAPKDGTYILAVVGPNDSRYMGHQVGRAFVIRHAGSTRSEGCDMGWSVYPGYGGAPDSYFTLWMPIPDHSPRGPYVSPIPAEEQPNYRRRVEGAPVIERQHLWPTPGGGSAPCDPRCCRECERERTWKEGQTHGV